MNKPKLDLLATVQLQEITGNAGLRVSKTQKNPADADIRLFSDGSCYPSQALMAEFGLEYQDKGSDIQERGFDIFQTEKWGMWPASEHFVMIAPVSKHVSKVDLFGKTSYDSKTGKPRSSVMDQGAATFGKRLIGMLEQTYGEELFVGGSTFVDLLIVRESPVPPTTNGIYNIPKLMVKGEKQGTYSVERRENIVIYPLVVVEDSFKVSTEEQDPAIGEIASLGNPVGGQYSDEAPLASAGEEDKISMEEAQEIIGLDKSENVSE